MKKSFAGSSEIPQREDLTLKLWTEMIERREAEPQDAAILERFPRPISFASRRSAS